eukprot:360558-Chlamydomonas_euryale.AAC.4
MRYSSRTFSKIIIDVTTWKRRPSRLSWAAGRRVDEACWCCSGSESVSEPPAPPASVSQRATTLSAHAAARAL